MSLAEHLTFSESFGRNLRSGLRLATLSPVSGEKFQVSIASIVAMLLLSVGIWMAFGYLQQSGTIWFNDYGVAVIAFAVLLGLLIAIGVARNQGGLDQLSRLLSVWSAPLPWIVLVLSIVDWHLYAYDDNTGHWLVALLWICVVSIRAIQVTFPGARFRVPASAAATIAVCFIIAGYRGLTPIVFYSFDDNEYDEYDDYYDFDTEAVLVRQPLLIADKLEGIRPGDPANTDVYFIGFAGDGDENVFASEASFAEQQISEIFDTEGRSLVLASDIETVDTEPLANTHNLFATISTVGSKMDNEDDILFLFMTSHGSKDASIAVSMYPLPLKALEAEALGSAMDDAEVQWRIIVVSACYAGSFIEPLQNEKTLIMTAASATKTSFGCSNERDLTYFGEAFLRDALQGSESLTRSFEDARDAIREREQSEGKTPSDPQIFVGEEIREKLDAMDVL